MQTNPISSATKGKTYLPHLSSALLVCLGIGIYLILSTVLISKDGVTFIQYAQKLSTCPRDILLTEDQHPGFPFIIVIFHQALRFVIDCPFSRWILSAQIASLFFKTLTIAALYFWGRSITDAQTSFRGLIIFLFLPHPAQYGSDALSDWPNLFFLVAGLLCLQFGLQQKKMLFFCLTGICGGIGYLIRPESFQLVLYALLMGGFLLTVKKVSLPRFVGISLAVILSFAVISFPYMKLKKNFFPKKTLIKITENTSEKSTPASLKKTARFQAGISAGPLFKSLPHLLSNFGETYMWYFCPFWIIGLIGWFRTTSSQAQVLLTLFISLNIFLMVLLYCSYGYMSDRHTLPLFTLTVPFIPLGIQQVTQGIKAKATPRNQLCLLYLLVFIGIIICLPKLLSPLGADKRIYKDVARWLQENVREEETIVVFDPRIGFYSQHQWVKFRRKNLKDADWIVTCVKTGENPKKRNLTKGLNLKLIETFQEPQKTIYISQISKDHRSMSN